MQIYRRIPMNVAHIEIGDRIDIKLDGNKYRSTAIHKVGFKTIFLTDDIICRQAMNEKDTTEGGYENSKLREYLNELTKTIPDDFINLMEPFDNGDYLMVLSLQEVFGIDEKSNKTDGQIEWFKDIRHRVAYHKNDYACWWLRSVTSASAFALVNIEGYAGYYYASNTWVGVRPAFVISNP